MKKTSSISKYFFWIVLAFLLVGCGSFTAPTAPALDMNIVLTQAAATARVLLTQAAIQQPRATSTWSLIPPDVNIVLTQAVATARVQLTQAANQQPTATSTLPPITSTALPTFTSLPSEKPSQTGTSEPLVTVKGLRAAYIIAGNLYVQDSGGQPVQLTSGGIDYKPTFADDGQKLVFFRIKNVPDRKNDYAISVYSINADGSQEQELANSSLLIKLNSRYDEFTEVRSLAFVPGTHHLLFNTHQTSQYANRFDYSEGRARNSDLLYVDADSAELRQLFSPGQGGYFGISPNGQQVWLLTLAGQIDLITPDGKIIRQNLAAYLANWPGGMTPDIFWTADSKRLNVMPIDDPMSAPPSTRTIWQYSILDDSRVEINFSPPLIGDMFSISPDGNQVVYIYESPVDQDVTRFGIYLGDLRSRTARRIAKTGVDELLGLFYDWSPDSTHFTFADEQPPFKIYIGNIQRKIAPLSCYQISGWLDARRFLCNESMGEVGKKGLARVMQFPEKSSIDDFTFVLPKSAAQTGQ